MGGYTLGDFAVRLYERREFDENAVNDAALAACYSDIYAQLDLPYVAREAMVLGILKRLPKPMEERASFLSSKGLTLGEQAERYLTAR